MTLRRLSPSHSRVHDTQRKRHCDHCLGWPCHSQRIGTGQSLSNCWKTATRTNLRKFADVESICDRSADRSHLLRSFGNYDRPRWLIESSELAKVRCAEHSRAFADIKIWKLICCLSVLPPLMSSSRMLSGFRFLAASFSIQFDATNRSVGAVANWNFRSNDHNGPRRIRRQRVGASKARHAVRHSLPASAANSKDSRHRRLNASR